MDAGEIVARTGSGVVGSDRGEAVAVMAWLSAQRSVNTRMAYARDLGVFRDWVTNLGGTLFEVTPTAVEAWINERLELESSATVDRRRGALSSFYTHAAKPGRPFEGRVNPASTNLVRPIKASSTHTPALSTAEMIALVTAAHGSERAQRDTAAVLILATGLRVSELCDLTVDDVNMVGGHCVVRVLGKGRKQRQVPIPPQVVPLLDLEREPSDPLVLNNTGEQLTRYQVRRVLARLQRAAGIETKLTPHVLRATCVTELLAQGAPLWAVQDLVGHADPRTTRGYQRRNQALSEGAAMVSTLAARIGA